MNGIQPYRNHRQEVNGHDLGASTPQETCPTDVYMKNLSVGGNVDMRSELILIPNQTQTNLPVVDSRLDHGEKRQDSVRNPPTSQGGLPSSFDSKMIVGVMLLLSMMAVIITVVLLNDDNIGDIITREEWGASPPICEMNPLELFPPKLVVIHHTVTEECTEFEKCTALIRSIQTYHMSTDLCEIGYNFLVGGDGRIYEGRGYKTAGDHLRTYNATTLGIAFIGNFTAVRPTDKQTRTALIFLEETKNHGHLAQDFEICGGNQLDPTKSAGQTLAEDMKHWSRYTDTPHPLD